MKSRLFALTAVAATLLTATVAAAPTAVAAPGDPNQVALRVEYPDGTSQQWCVNYTAGMSGAAVLAVAGPSYGSGPYAGFVLRIGGQGTVPPTDQKYWAYWTTTNGTLTYSGTGVTSTTPKAGTVEAWHWNSSGATEKPSAGSYRSICPGGYEQASSTAPATTPASAATSGAGTSHGAATAPTAGATAGGGSAAAGNGGGAAASTDPTAGSTTPAAATTPGAAPSTSPSGGTAGVGRTVDASPVAMSTDNGGSGKPLGLALAAFAVVALGAAAAWQRRRRSATDE